VKFGMKIECEHSYALYLSYCLLVNSYRSGDKLDLALQNIPYTESVLQ
jgi:hypothetical protein